MVNVSEDKQNKVFNCFCWRFAVLSATAFAPPVSFVHDCWRKFWLRAKLAFSTKAGLQLSRTANDLQAELWTALIIFF